jgi:hypothetical protein
MRRDDDAPVEFITITCYSFVEKLSMTGDAGAVSQTASCVMLVNCTVQD